MNAINISNQAVGTNKAQSKKLIPCPMLDNNLLWMCVNKIDMQSSSTNFSYLSFSSCSSKDFCLFFTRKSTINSEGIEGGILNSPPSDRLSESAGLKHKKYCLSYFDCKQS